MRLILSDSWQELLRSWCNAPRYVAVAYFSCDDDLIFSADDVLIVDASDKAITSSQTSAKALQRVVKAGAKVFSHPDLHAKIYALGSHVYVGSANASNNSRSSLIECLGYSDDPFVVSEARRLVLGLTADANRVDDTFLERALVLPVSPRPPRGRQRNNPAVASEARSWLLGMHEVDFPGDADEIELDSEKYEASLPADEAAQWFWWPANGSLFYREASENDIFIQIWRKGPSIKDASRVRVYPPTTIDKITKTDNDKRRAYHFAEGGDRETRSITWRQFLRTLSQIGWEPKIGFGSAREMPDEKARLLSRVWPK